MRTDVVVVGAGPTGLAVDCWASSRRGRGAGARRRGRAGRDVPRPRSAATRRRSTYRLGVLGELAERALPINKVSIIVEGRELARLKVGAAMERLGGRTGLIISQAEIEAQLRERLAELGGTVEWGHRVAGLRNLRADGVSVRLDDATEIDAAWVIGADGAHSVIRKACNVGFPACRSSSGFCLPMCTPTWTGHAMRR